MDGQPREGYAFTASARFIDDSNSGASCECCEFRQFVRITRVDRWWGEIAETPGWVEDCITFADTYRDAGCTYSMEDAPGRTPRPVHEVWEFQGQIVDRCNGGLVRERKRFKLKFPNKRSFTLESVLLDQLVESKEVNDVVAELSLLAMTSAYMGAFMMRAPLFFK